MTETATCACSVAGEGERKAIGVDPDIKPYKSAEFTVALDHQFSPHLVAGVRYTHRNLLRAIEDIGVLDADGSEVYLIGNPGFGKLASSSATGRQVQFGLKLSF